MNKLWVHIVLGGLVSLLLVGRFTYLEQDMPPHNIMGMNEADEPYYCIKGLQEYKLEKEDIPKEFEFPNHPYVFSLHNSWISYLSLKVFGNNFIGLRLPSVIASVLAILFMLLLVRNIGVFNRIKNSTSLIWFCSFLLLTDFYFFSVSRYMNPQVFSIFWISLGLFLFFRGVIEEKRNFIIGGYAFLLLACFYVYPYIVFVPLGISLFFLYRSISELDIRWVAYGLFGALVAFGAFGLLLYIHGFGYQDYLERIQAIHSSRNETLFASKTFFVDLLRSPLSIFYTLLNRFNPLFIFVIVNFFVWVLVLWRKVRSYEKALFFVLVASFVQAALMSSYPQKKWVMLLPVLVCCMPFLYRELLAENKRYRVVKVLSLFASLGIGYKCISVNNTEMYWSAFSYAYPYIDMPKLLLGLNYAALIIIFFTSIYFLFTAYRSRLFYMVSVAVFVFSAVFVPFSLSFYYYFVDKYYIEKRFLSRNSNKVDDNYILSGFSHFYSFYSGGVPLISPYYNKHGYKNKISLHSEDFEADELVMIKKFHTQEKFPPTIDRYGFSFVRSDVLKSPYKGYVLYVGEKSSPDKR